MTWQPIVTWWLLAVLAALPLGFAVWRTAVEWRTTRRWAWLRRTGMVLLIVLICLRPSIPGPSRTSGNGLLDVYFVIDDTVSASAEDYDGTKTRIEGMRRDAKDIASALIGARFSVITFGNTVQTTLPLTNDTAALGSAVDMILPVSSYYATGSSIDAPIDDLKSELTRVAAASPDRGRVVFYLGDGEQTHGDTPKSFAGIKPLIRGGAVLGYGTTSGGKMRTQTYDGSVQYLKDYSSGTYPTPEALSKIDETKLQAIASQLGVTYTHRTAPGDTAALVKTIDVGKIISGSRDAPSQDDLYWIPALGLLCLLSYDIWRIYLEARSLRRTRRKEKV